VAKVLEYDPHLNSQLVRLSQIQQTIAQQLVQIDRLNEAATYYDRSVESYRRLFELNGHYFGSDQIRSYRKLLLEVAGYHERQGNQEQTESLRKEVSRFESEFALDLESD
jgi:hypothetical protein